MTENITHAVAWLERDYDTAPFHSGGYTPGGLFQLRRDHSPACPCESPAGCEAWTYSSRAAKWTAGGAS